MINSKNWIVEYIEDDIIKYLNSGKKVFIENGSLNDQIISYSVKFLKNYLWQEYEERKVIFTTSACVFPLYIDLINYSDIDTEEFEGNLFIKIS